MGGTIVGVVGIWPVASGQPIIIRYSTAPKRQYQLTDEHIVKIIATYQFCKESPRYSRRAGMEEIAKSDFNLNISRYISTAVGEAEIDLQAT